jgi:hypothetical protein
MNIKHILDGVVNTIQAKKEIEAIAQERYSICAGCEFNSENAKKEKDYKSVIPYEHCTICKCNLTFKTHSLHSECPIKKWLAVATEEENMALKQKLKDNE